MKQIFIRRATVAAAITVFLLYCAVVELQQGSVLAGPLERKFREEVLCVKQYGSALDNSLSSNSASLQNNFDSVEEARCGKELGSKSRAASDRSAQATVGEASLASSTLDVPRHCLDSAHSYICRPTRFILYRLIGNDMPPLQRTGQLLWNTVYALEHEAQFPDCQKRWVLNKIVNQTIKAALLEVLNKHGYGSQDIVDIKIDLSKLESANATTWERSVITQNAGRNAAIEDGVRAGSRWLLVFDGNQFLTNEGWQGIVASADRAEIRGLKYFKVPMYRLRKIQDPSWLNNSAVYASLRDYVPVKGESQIVLRGDALARFDEGLKYGHANKMRFLWNICGRRASNSSRCGCGDIYPEDFEEDGNSSVSFNTYVVEQCGYTLRLWSYYEAGVDWLEALGNSTYRGQLRVKARLRMVQWVQGAIEAQLKASYMLDKEDSGIVAH